MEGWLKDIGMEKNASIFATNGLVLPAMLVDVDKHEKLVHF